LIGLTVLGALLVGLVGGAASGAGTKKLVEGTVYDTTCAGSCTPECPPPPHCGPITQAAKDKVVCAQRPERLIVCPLSRARAGTCVPDTPYGLEGTDPIYSGEGATINVRRRGSATVLATLSVIEGHFKIRLGPGEYVLRAFLPEPQCWMGVGLGQSLKLTARSKGPIAVPISVANSCVAHPDAAK
jgi:hypothetical protein